MFKIDTQSILKQPHDIKHLASIVPDFFPDSKIGIAYRSV